MTVPADPGASFDVVEPEGGFEFAVVVLDAPAAWLGGPVRAGMYRRRAGRAASGRWVRPGWGPIARVASSRAGHRRHRAGARVGSPGRRDAPAERGSARTAHRPTGPGRGRVWVAGPARSSSVSRAISHFDRYRSASGGLRRRPSAASTHARRPASALADAADRLPADPTAVTPRKSPPRSPPTAPRTRTSSRSSTAAAKHRHDPRTSDTPQQPNKALLGAGEWVSGAVDGAESDAYPGPRQAFTASRLSVQGV